MRALLLLQLVFGQSRSQSGDGTNSGNKRVTTSFDIVTETKIIYSPALLDTASTTYSTEKDRVVDETRPGFEAAAARTGATLISIDVLFSLSSSFSARRRRQARQTVFTQITPTLSIVEINPDVPQFELASVAEVEQEMTSVVAAADSTSVFVRDATIETGDASSSSVDVPLDFPIVDGVTTTTRATTTTTTNTPGDDFPIVDGVTTTTRATTTTKSTTTTTRAGGATTPSDFPIVDGTQTTLAPTTTQGNDFPVVDDATTINEDNTDNDTVTTTTLKGTTRSTITANPDIRPTGFPIYDDQEIVTTNNDGLFPVIDDNTTTTTQGSNTTTTKATTPSATTASPSRSTPTDFPIYEDQNITDSNTGFPVVPDSNSTTTITSTTNTTIITTTTDGLNTTTDISTVSLSTASVSLETTAEPNTSKKKKFSQK
ncbi:unnamed protein product [Oikopleura dioica]|uniref:SEA domain-containing protein n=1 Tax=Oikopleura dioica TaxID=34765 RepID=E4Y0B5_OIKDI|nr:unnamed protein product [Oikopleura dioica]